MRKLIMLIAIGVGMAISGQAGAATWTVFAGQQTQDPPAGVPETAELNQFFPGVLQIHRGDKVRVVSKSFHTATFLGSTRPGPPVVPEAGATYSDVPPDAAGVPFYFNSLMRFIFNPSVFGPVGDKVIDDRRLHNSGILTPPQGAATFTFPRLGTFRLVCVIHPGMQSRIVVRPPSADLASRRTVRIRALQEIAASWEKAQELVEEQVPANTVYAGVETGGSGGKVTLLGFLPETLTVPSGTTVNFVNESPSEIHNMVWGPRSWIQPFDQATEFLPMGPGSRNQLSPTWIYGSDPPGVYSYDGTNHGNGFLATPLTDDQPGNPPQGLPKSLQVTFTRPGTYHYYCHVHGPDMSGDIVVT